MSQRRVAPASAAPRAGRGAAMWGRALLSRRPSTGRTRREAARCEAHFQEEPGGCRARASVEPQHGPRDASHWARSPLLGAVAPQSIPAHRTEFCKRVGSSPAKTQPNYFIRPRPRLDPVTRIWASHPANAATPRTLPSRPRREIRCVPDSAALCGPFRCIGRINSAASASSDASAPKQWNIVEVNSREAAE